MLDSYINRMNGPSAASVALATARETLSSAGTTIRDLVQSVLSYPTVDAGEEDEVEEEEEEEVEDLVVEANGEDMDQGEPDESSEDLPGATNQDC